MVVTLNGPTGQYVLCRVDRVLQPGHDLAQIPAPNTVEQHALNKVLVIQQKMHNACKGFVQVSFLEYIIA